tara:strand:+ start:344 stop:742 length:399 start_codon:yes stop_codon:yes gene_type:complete
MKLITGIDQLKQLNRRQVVRLLDANSYIAISNLYRVLEREVREILASKIEEFDIKVKQNTVIIEPRNYDFNISEEKHASTTKKTKQIITKDGLFLFKRNSPIYKVKNELTEVVKTYVCAMLNNNQPLKFTTR